jgi:hypothetical protein
MRRRVSLTWRAAAARAVSQRSLPCGATGPRMCSGGAAAAGAASAASRRRVSARGAVECLAEDVNGLINDGW